MLLVPRLVDLSTTELAVLSQEVVANPQAVYPSEDLCDLQRLRVAENGMIRLPISRQTLLPLM
jgi:hypothetical protein